VGSLTVNPAFRRRRDRVAEVEAEAEDVSALVLMLVVLISCSCFAIAINVNPTHGASAISPNGRGNRLLMACFNLPARALCAHPCHWRNPRVIADDGSRGS
jgi:hypothetical protein